MCAFAAAGLAAPLLPAVSLDETRKKTNPMSHTKVGHEDSQSVEIYYEDHGSSGAHPWPAVERRRAREADRPDGPMTAAANSHQLRDAIR
jgi:hypothetical protein